MKATAALLAYELRRHASTVVTAWLLLVPLPLVHRLVEGHWGYWQGDWREGGALFAQFLIAPVLAGALALSGWAEERSAGTLGWLYARPLSTTAIFAARIGAVVAALTLYLAVAQAAHLRRPLQLRALPDDLLELKFMGFVPLTDAHWLLGLALIVSGGVLASSVAGSTPAALKGFLLGAALVVLVSLALWRPLFWSAIRWRIDLVTTVHLAQIGLWALAAAGGAWAAVRVAPMDRSRVRRAALAAAGPTAAGCLVVLVLLVHPVYFGRVTSLGARDMGEGARIELVRSSAMRPRVAVSRLRLASNEAITIRRTGPAVIQLVFVSPQRGLAVVKYFGKAGGGWDVLARSGEVRELAFPPEVSWRTGLYAVGWSPRGSRFAWKTRSGSHLLIMDEEFQVTRLRVVQRGWRASWIDEAKLLIAGEPEPRWIDDPGPAPVSRGGGRWWIVDLGRIEALGHEHLRAPGLWEIGRRDERRMRLFPGLMATPFGTPWTEELPRLDGLPLAVVSHESGFELAALDPSSGRLESMHYIDASPVLRRFGFGNGSAGELVWLQPLSPERQAEVRVMLLQDASEEPTTSCTFLLRPETELVRWRGNSGGWVVWEEGVSQDFWSRPDNPRRTFGHPVRLLACRVDTGEGREFEDIGALGTVAVTEGGLLTPEGLVPLAD